MLHVPAWGVVKTLHALHSSFELLWNVEEFVGRAIASPAQVSTLVMVLTLSARHIRKILDVLSIGEIQQTSTYYLVYYYRVESWSLR